MSSSGVEQVNPGKFEPSNNLKLVYAVFIFLGVLSFVLGILRLPERTWHAYLLGFFYFSSLALGGLFFAALQHVSKAGWSVTVRRFAEGFTAFLPWAFGLGLILAFFGTDSLYLWMNEAYVAKDPILLGKVGYLNEPFFLARFIGFFILWWLFAKVIVGRSLRQDITGDIQLTLKNVGMSIAFILVFALSYSVFAMDMLMSLEPHWFSTIFGVYAFAGLFQSTIAMMILVAIQLMKSGHVKKLVTEEHLHDLGKFLKAFTVFWAYIAFSQYLLIWYANLPEETVFYYHRSHGGWALVSSSLLLFKFVIPFLALLPRQAKRSPGHLASVAILILFMQFIDLYWLIYPNFSGHEVVLGPLEVGIFLGFLGIFLFAVARFYKKNAVVPLKDPRIAEALNHHVTY